MLTVGVLGAGGMGNVHARQFRKMDDVEIIFFDPDQTRSEAYVKTWSAMPADSVDDLISKADIVDVCLPSDMHTEFGLKAVAAGRATFVEKPIASTVTDGARLVAAADKAGVPFMVGQVVRFFPEYAAGNRLVKAGRVGNPAAARTRRGGGLPRGEWFLDFKRSGGVLVDLAVHDFDWLRWTLGEVKSVYSRSVAAKSGGGPDYALTTLSFDSGAVAHVEATWMDPSGFRATYEVAGSEGLIEYDSRQVQTLRVATSGKTLTEAPLSAHDDPYYKQLSAFVSAVKTNTQVPVSGFDGLMALSIAEAAMTSALTDQVVQPARQF